MKNSILIGTTCFVMFILSSIMPLAFAQNAGQGYQGSLEEQLNLAREKVYKTTMVDHPPYLFANPLVIVIPVIIACGSISAFVLLKTRLHSKTK